MKQSKSGFTTVWLVMILSSLILLLLVIIEASSGFVCSSICRSACAGAGQSVLSEYNTPLYEHYGVFALRANDTKLSSAASYYIGNNISAENCIVKPKQTDCTVMTESYPGLNYELFEAQRKALGIQTGISSALNGNTLTEAVSGLAELSEHADSLSDTSLDTLQKMKKESSANAKDLEKEASVLKEELTEIRKSDECDDHACKELEEEINKLEDEADEARDDANKAKDLIRRYNSAIDPDFSEEGGKVISLAVSNQLPSTVLEIKETISLVLSGGIAEFSPDALACGEYILNTCSNLQKKTGNTVLDGETEYILFGHKEDGRNLGAVKRGLFSIRFPLALEAIYSDASKMAEYNAAAAAFLPVPTALTVFVMASVDASARALSDIERLCAGADVPFINGGKGGSYTDHLRILLLLLPQDTKMIRLMDIMQMDLTEKFGEAFAFRDFCYGFDMTAEFEKRVRVSVIDIPSIRKGKINITVCYK